MNENLYTPSKPLMQKLGILNVYQLNIYNILLLVYKSMHGLSPTSFATKFSKIQHKYQTRNTSKSLQVPPGKLMVSRFSVGNRGPLIWNKFVDRNINEFNSLHQFQVYVKQKLFSTVNELDHF